MYPLLWNWISGICRQKRILLLLCAFGSSFIFLNYSLLSSSSILPSSTTTTRRQSQDLFPNINDELDVIDTGISGQKKYQEVAKRKFQSSYERMMLIASKKPFDSYTREKPSESGKTAEKYSMKAISKLQPIRGTNDLPALGQSYSNKHGNKYGVIFISATENQGTNGVNKTVKSDSHNATSNNNTDGNYINTDKETDDGKPSIGATITSSISPLLVGESIITGNGKNLVNNNLSSSISSVLLSSLSSSLSPIILNSQKSILPENVLEKPPKLSPSSSSTKMTLKHGKHYNNGSNYETTIINSNTHAESTSPASILTSNFSTSPFDIPSCNTPNQLHRVQKRKKNLTVIENFIMGWKRVKCNETITYTTHGDYRYLDNLVPLVERWDGPVSLSIYAPGTDLEKTLGIISYLKMCTSSKINEWVTFHLIYDVKHSTRPTQSNGKPGDILWLDGLYQSGKWRDCSEKPSFNKYDHTFRIENGLLYPINIARNIARAAAKTYFVLASDIELYPSINLIPSFMKMLKRLQRNKSNYSIKTVAKSVASKLFFTSMSSIMKMNDSKTETLTTDQNPEFSMQAQGHRQDLSNYPPQNRHVFVLPVFEVKKDVLPCQVETKEQLLTLMKKRAAVIFHHSICPQCHTFPKFGEWKVGVPSEGKREMPGCDGNTTLNTMNGTIQPMSIFHKAKRKFPYQLWEPIFIGTKDEPIYDERLSWEGLRDKMVSGYVMCALNYDFYILENAFLVHKPGIRRVVHLVTKTVMNQDRLINYRIRSELQRKFGKHEECAL